MNKPKVYIQYPIGISDSQYYKSIIKYNREVEYLNTNKKTGIIVNKNKFIYFDKSKKIIRYLLEKVPLPIPNAHYTKDNNFDLIHSAHCLSLNKSPWVADIEFINQMWGSIPQTKLRITIVRKLISSVHCKKIIAWTETTKKDIIKMFPEIRDKVDVVYYALPIQNKDKKESKDITLFFSGRHFYAKGGLHAVEIMDRLTKKYKEVRGIINGAIPKEIIDKYGSNKKLEFHQLMPHKDILKLYKKADILVYPGYSDSFGFVFMEAMSFGIPIITVDGYSRREIIGDGKHGFIIKRPKEIIRGTSIYGYENTIKEMVKKTELLIKDKQLRKVMGMECIKEVKEGKFSIDNRNKKLNKIYKEALK